MSLSQVTSVTVESHYRTQLDINNSWPVPYKLEVFGGLYLTRDHVYDSNKVDFFSICTQKRRQVESGHV